MLEYAVGAGDFRTAMSWDASWWNRRNVEIVARELRASGFATKVRRAFFTEPPFRVKLWVSWQGDAPTAEPFPRPVRVEFGEVVPSPVGEEGEDDDDEWGGA